jgi:hypothetical protein
LVREDGSLLGVTGGTGTAAVFLGMGVEVTGTELGSTTTGPDDSALEAITGITSLDSVGPYTFGRPNAFELISLVTFALNDGATERDGCIIVSSTGLLSFPFTVTSSSWFTCLFHVIPSVEIW